MSVHDCKKALIAPLRAALYDCDPDRLSTALKAVFATDCAIHLAFPFEDLEGPGVPRSQRTEQARGMNIS